MKVTPASCSFLISSSELSYETVSVKEAKYKTAQECVQLYISQLMSVVCFRKRRHHVQFLSFHLCLSSLRSRGYIVCILLCFQILLHIEYKSFPKTRLTLLAGHNTSAGAEYTRTLIPPSALRTVICSVY